MKYRLWLLPAMLVSTGATADIVWMRNGDRLTGTIEEISDEQVRIALPYSAAVTVRRDAIKRWRLDKQDGPKPLAKSGITLAKTPNDPDAWLWTGTGDLNVKLKDNDKKTHNVNLKGSTEFANLNWRYSLDGEYIYETANSVTNSHEYRLQPMLDFFFAENWFVRSSIDLDYDLLDANYLDLGYATGLGYRFWNDKQRRLELISQVGLERSYFSIGYWDNVSIPGIFADRIINYPFLNLGWDYRQPVSLWNKEIELFSKGSYEKYLAQPSPYLTRAQSVKGSLGVRYYFNDHLRLSWSSELNWEDAWLDYGGAKTSLEEKEWRHQVTLGASF